MPSAPRVNIRKPDLRDELAIAVSDAVSDVLNACGAGWGLRPLRWFARDTSTRFSGHASLAEYPPAECVSVVREWVEKIGLRSDVNPAAGTDSYSGRIEGLSVQVWRIADEEAFYRTSLHGWSA